MTSLAIWLTQNGLEQYAARFEENDLDLDVVATLTDADLVSLGVSLGHRRKLMAAAALLHARAPAPVSGRQAVAASPASQVERRQVTVLFADLVGSTALSARLDPEEMSLFLRRYQNTCTARIAANEGHVAKLMGDGVMAYFGFPLASETAAECAVRAGIEVVQFVSTLVQPDGQAARARIGIATGVVVIGELIGTDTAQERSIVGDTPNMAARLQALAEPGEVLVSEITKQLTGRLFESEFRGVHDLKGFAQPIPVWRMGHELDIESRFDAVRSVPAVDGVFLGRERELEFILSAWAATARGEGHAIMLCGEAGMGKSRLLEVIAASLKTMPHRLLRCQCSPFHRTNPLFPIAQLLRRMADVRAEKSAADNVGALVGFLKSCDLFSRHAQLLLAELLDLSSGDEISAMEMTKPQKKAATLDLLVKLLSNAPGALPTLLLVEDAHWIDPTTQQLLGMLIAKIDTASMLAVVTHRPEYVAPWADLPQVTTLACKKLGPAHCQNLIRAVSARFALQQDVIDEIVRRSDGVPLFIEELTRAVVESRSVQTASVPVSLRDSLTSRLDRLGAAKDVALVASVLGRQFGFGLLCALIGAPADELRETLERLRHAGIILRVEAEDETRDEYSFSHSLVQEAAYESLLKSRRQALHGKVGEILGAGGDAAAQVEPAVLAHHYGRAGRPAEAGRLWIEAAESAVDRSAFAESMACLDHALAEAELVQDSQERDLIRLDALLRRGTTNIIQSGPLSPEAEAALTEAHQLAHKTGLVRPLFQATWGLYLHAATTRRFDLADQHGRALSELVGQIDGDDFRVEALHHRWGISYFKGNLRSQIEFSEEATKIYVPEKHHHFAHVFAGHDAGVCAFCVMAGGLNLTGRITEGGRAIRQGMELAESLSHPMSIQFALAVSAMAHYLTGQFDQAAPLANRHLDIANRYGFVTATPCATFLLAALELRNGPAVGAVESLEKNLDGALRFGLHGLYPAAMLAQALTETGRAQEGLQVLDKVLASTPDPEIGAYMPEIWRIRGQAALAASRDNADIAQSYLATALSIATRQEADMLRLRAATDLAQLLAERGQVDQARATLAPILSQLPDACACQERTTAQRMLAQLA